RVVAEHGRADLHGGPAPRRPCRSGGRDRGDRAEEATAGDRRHGHEPVSLTFARAFHTLGRAFHGHRLRHTHRPRSYIVVSRFHNPAPEPPVTHAGGEGIAWITLDRPAMLNALNTELAAALAEHAEAAAADPAVTLVVVRGAGRAFCSGMDRTALAAGSVDEAFYRHWIRGLNCLEDMPKISIAVLHGYAIGGGLQLALACDLRLAAADAVLGLGATRHVLIPDGAVQRRACVIALGRSTRVRAQNACMGSWEIDEANRAWTEKREAVFYPPRTP